jgi:hypothetical protein
MQQKQFIEAVKSQNLSEVARLLAEGAHPNEQDEAGKTALHYAATSQPFYESRRDVQVMLDLALLAGITALALPLPIMAMMKVGGIKQFFAGSICLAGIVLSIILRKNANTAKKVLAQPHYRALLEQLGNAGGDFNLPDQNGQTPFDQVVKSHNIEAITTTARLFQASFTLAPLPGTISDHYDISGNSPLEKAEIILFGETHDDYDQIAMNHRTLHQLVKDRDLILLERPFFYMNGCQELLTPLCDFLGSSNNLESQDNNCTVVLENFRDNARWQQAHCFSWDDPIKMAIVTCSFIPRIFFLLIGTTFLEPIFQTLSIQWRNDHMIATIEKARALGWHRIFVIAGKAHLPIDPHHESYPHTQKLLKYLGTKKYVVLIKKNQTAKTSKDQVG